VKKRKNRVPVRKNPQKHLTKCVKNVNMTLSNWEAGTSLSEADTFDRLHKQTKTTRTVGSKCRKPVEETGATSVALLIELKAQIL
jgi:hypothetical protein